jgi:hypothetical protein
VTRETKGVPAKSPSSVGSSAIPNEIWRPIPSRIDVARDEMLWYTWDQVGDGLYAVRYEWRPIDANCFRPWAGAGPAATAQAVQETEEAGRKAEED